MNSFSDELVALKETGSWSGGGTPSKANPSYWEGGAIPWVSPKDMKTFEIVDSQDKITPQAVADSPVRVVPTGSILMVVRSGILAHTFPVAIAKTDVTLNQDMKAITPQKGIIPKFLAYQLISQTTDILKNCTKTGTTVASVETKLLQSLPVWIPDTSKQEVIVADLDKQLSRLAHTTSTLRAIQTKIKQARASILKAAVEGRLVETEGEAPWITKPLRDLISDPMRNGKSAKASPNGKGIRIATLTAVTANQFTVENTKIAELDPSEFNDLWMQPGDIFVQRSNAPELVGLSAMYSGKTNWAIFPDLMIRVRCSGEILPKWMLVNLQAPNTRRFFKENSKGSSGSMPKISQSVIGNALITCPPLQVQQASLEEADRRFAVLDRLEIAVRASLVRCGHLRQAIFKRAFGG